MSVEKLPPEIWKIIGEKADTRRSLRSLCETCRRFHIILTPILFSRIRFTSFAKIVSKSFRKFLSLDHLRYVTDLTVIVGIRHAVGPGWSSPPEMQGTFYSRFNARLIECFKAMPNLASFSFGKPGAALTEEDEDEGVNLVPLFDETLSALRSHNPKLTNLSICMYDGGEWAIGELHDWLGGDESFAWTNHISGNLTLNIGGFQNMTSLRLFDIYGDVTTNIKALVSIFLASPNLLDLALGLPYTYHRSDATNYLLKICRSYAASGGRPLSLKRLYLDYGLIVYADDEKSNRPEASYIPLLTDLRALQSLHVHNHFTPNMYGEYPSWVSLGRKLAYNTMSDPSRCLSLRRFSAAKLDEDLFNLIKVVGQDLSLPPSFLSEIVFKQCDYPCFLKDGFGFHPDKLAYWPKLFFVGSPETHQYPTTYRHGLIREICGWQRLERLHFSVDFLDRRDRRLVLNLAKALSNNLKELSISEIPKPFSQQPEDLSSSEEDDEDDEDDEDAEDDSCDDDAAWEDVSGDDDDSSSWEDVDESDGELLFAEQLCTRCDLRYLHMFNHYLRVHKITTWNSRGPRTSTWLEEMTEEQEDEVEIFRILHE